MAKLKGTRVSTRMGTTEDGAASWLIQLSYGAVKVGVAFSSQWLRFVNVNHNLFAAGTLFAMLVYEQEIESWR